MPTRDGVPLFRPGRLASLAVALALFAAAALVLARVGWLAIALPGWMPRAGTWAIAAVFAARAIGEGRYLGFAKRVRDTAFARLDTWLFSPICAALALLAAVVASGAA